MTNNDVLFGEEAPLSPTEIAIAAVAASQAQNPVQPAPQPAPQPTPADQSIQPATYVAPAIAAQPQSTAVIPAFMQGYEDEGKDELDDHIIAPRAKLVQKLSDDALLAEFGAGAAVVMPQRDLLMDNQGVIEVVPIFFFVEYISMNPITLRGSEPMILERSYDPKSNLAMRCRNPATYSERVVSSTGAEKEITNAEVLNFVCVIDTPGNVFNGTPIVFSFMKSEHMTGSSWCSKIKLRKGVPIYGTRFTLSIDQRQNASGNWFAFVINNPPEPTVTNEAKFAFLRDLHLKYKASHANKSLEVDYSEDAVS